MMIHDCHYVYCWIQRLNSRIDIGASVNVVLHPSQHTRTSTIYTNVQ